MVSGRGSPRTSEGATDPSHVQGRRPNAVLDRILPHREKRIVKKLVRSWFIQGIGWYALTEVAARALLEGGALIALWTLGYSLPAILLLWVGFHTLVWFVLYGGFMRIWIVLGFSAPLSRLRAHFERLDRRAKTQSIFRYMFVRGSTARGEMNERSDIDIIMVPRGSGRSLALGILFLWGLRVESMFRRVAVEARWIDLKRYAPWHHIEETPLVLYDAPDLVPNAAADLASRGILIAFSGLDGSGKSLIAKRLVPGLRERGYDAVYLWGHRQAWYTQEVGPDISFGILYESLWKRIGRRIADFGDHPFAKVMYDAATAADYAYIRWKIVQLLKPNRIVVADRYVADVLAYLRSWGPLKVTVEGLLVGMSAEPHLAILFDIDPVAARQRKQENPLAQLERFAKEYEALVPFLHLVRVDAGRSVEEVYAQVAGVLEERLGFPLSGSSSVGGNTAVLAGKTAGRDAQEG